MSGRERAAGAGDADTRMTWMDALRGAAILMLLVWHAVAVPQLFGIEMPAAVRAVNAFFLPYRMPALMLLSGMLLTRSLRKPLPEYFAGKFAMIAWPYLLWVVVAKATFLDVEGMPWWHWRAWYATSYLWFLFFIGVFYLLAPALRRLPPWVPVAAAAVGGALLPTGSTEQRMAFFAVFFFAGAWLTAAREPARLLPSGRVALLLAVPAVAYGVAAVWWTDVVQYAVWGAPCSIAGCLALATAFRHAPKIGPVGRSLRFAGRHSIVFYVSHFPIMAMVTESVGAHVPALALAALNLAAALAVGILFARADHRAPVRWLFRAPDTLTRSVRRALRVVGDAVSARGTRRPTA